MVSDRPHGDHGVSAHELRRGADVGGLPELRRRLARPAIPHRGQEHRLLRAPRTALRLPDPAHSRGPDERGAEAARPLQRACVPAGRDPARRRRAPVEDVLRRQLARRLQHCPALGRSRAVPVAAVAAVGDALDRALLDLGQRRRDDHHLPRGADRGQPGALRGGLSRRRRAAAQGLAHHPASDSRHPPRNPDPADHRDGAGVPRALPVHLGRAEQRDADGAAPDLQLRVRELARRRFRQGDGAQPHARRLPRRSSRSSTCARRGPGARDEQAWYRQRPHLGARLAKARGSAGGRARCTRSCWWGSS